MANDQLIIDRIEGIRAKNNILWMDILRIAMREAPKETKRVMNDITTNDERVSHFLSILSEDKPQRRGCNR